jgi:anti-sigma factor ChrR (cupin superfamily)
LPAHRHKSNEQCLVLQGDIEWEGHRYSAGDFLVVSTAHEHTPVTSEKGALILIVGG